MRIPGCIHSGTPRCFDSLESVEKTAWRAVRRSVDLGSLDPKGGNKERGNLTDGLEPFRAAARATDDEEIAVRKEANARIAILERARAHAYRRLDFVTTLDETARSAASRPEAVARQKQAVLDRFGWTGFDSDPRRAISDAIAPLVLAIASIHHGENVDEGPAPTDQSPDLRMTLYAFEDWYRTTFGSEFWTLADHFFPDTPLVDF